MFRYTETEKKTRNLLENAGCRREDAYGVDEDSVAHGLSVLHESPLHVADHVAVARTRESTGTSIVTIVQRAREIRFAIIRIVVVACRRRGSLSRPLRTLLGWPLLRRWSLWPLRSSRGRSILNNNNNINSLLSKLVLSDPSNASFIHKQRKRQSNKMILRLVLRLTEEFSTSRREERYFDPT